MADQKIPILTPKDLAVLRRLLDWAKKVRPNPSLRTGPIDEGHQGPEVYVAKTPAAGIPALAVDTGTGTSGVGIGSAECPIYRVDLEYGSYKLIAVAGLEYPVYNPTMASVDGDSWLLVVRDKFGNWMAVTGGGGTGDRIEVVELANSGVVPPAGYLDARIRIWRPNTGVLEVGAWIWLKDVTSDPP